MSYITHMTHSDVKDFYNKTMPQKYGEDYEHNRWFKNPLLMAGYNMTRDVIKEHVIDDESLHAKRILELGPGAGTWTKLLLARFPDADFDLVDISKEMLARSNKALPSERNINYIESDVLEWEPSETYDFFFSSRVLEYIDNKEAFAKKIFDVLNPHSAGFLITKMPHYKRDRFLGRSVDELHRGQISPILLGEILRKAGFIDVQLYPVTMSVPFFSWGSLNSSLRKVFAARPLGPISMMFAESYAVVFRVPAKK